MGSSADKTARTAFRAAQVNKIWEQVARKIWHDPAVVAFILAHTNKVLIVRETDKAGVEYKKLCVYTDDSTVHAEINGMRERIKLEFHLHFNEDLREFDIYTSRGARRREHPFAEQVQTAPQKVAPRALTSQEIVQVEQRVAGVTNKKLQETLKAAMIADLEWKKGVNEKNLKQGEN